MNSMATLLKEKDVRQKADDDILMIIKPMTDLTKKKENKYYIEKYNILNINIYKCKELSYVRPIQFLLTICEIFNKQLDQIYTNMEIENTLMTIKDAERFTNARAHTQIIIKILNDYVLFDKLNIVLPCLSDLQTEYSLIMDCGKSMIHEITKKRNMHTGYILCSFDFTDFIKNALNLEQFKNKLVELGDIHTWNYLLREYLGAANFMMFCIFENPNEIKHIFSKEYLKSKLLKFNNPYNKISTPWNAELVLDHYINTIFPGSDDISIYRFRDTVDTIIKQQTEYTLKSSDNFCNWIIHSAESTYISSLETKLKHSLDLCQFVKKNTLSAIFANLELLYELAKCELNNGNYAVSQQLFKVYSKHIKKSLKDTDLKSGRKCNEQLAIGSNEFMGEDFKTYCAKLPKEDRHLYYLLIISLMEVRESIKQYGIANTREYDRYRLEWQNWKDEYGTKELKIDQVIKLGKIESDEINFFSLTSQELYEEGVKLFNNKKNNIASEYFLEYSFRVNNKCTDVLNPKDDKHLYYLLQIQEHLNKTQQSGVSAMLNPYIHKWHTWKKMHDCVDPKDVSSREVNTGESEERMD
jgi:hypothetical protein